MGKASDADAAYQSLQVIEDWWLQVTEYANCEGDRQLFTLRPDFYDLNLRAERIARGEGVDFGILKYAGDLIERREGILGREVRGAPDQHANISEIVNAVYRCVPAKDELQNKLGDKANGRQTAKNPPPDDGPCQPRTWRRNGEKINNNMQAGAWNMVNHLWSADDRSADFDDLKLPVYGDINHLADAAAFGSLRRAANRFFTKHGIPWRVSLSKTTVSLVESE